MRSSQVDTHLVWKLLVLPTADGPMHPVPCVQCNPRPPPHVAAARRAPPLTTEQNCTLYLCVLAVLLAVVQQPCALCSCLLQLQGVHPLTTPDDNSYAEAVVKADPKIAQLLKERYVRDAVNPCNPMLRT